MVQPDPTGVTIVPEAQGTDTKIRKDVADGRVVQLIQALADKETIEIHTAEGEKDRGIEDEIRILMISLPQNQRENRL